MSDQERDLYIDLLKQFSIVLHQIWDEGFLTNTLKKNRIWELRDVVDAVLLYNEVLDPANRFSDDHE